LFNPQIFQNLKKELDKRDEMWYNESIGGKDNDDKGVEQ